MWSLVKDEAIIDKKSWCIVVCERSVLYSWANKPGYPIQWLFGLTTPILLLSKCAEFLIIDKTLLDGSLISMSLRLATREKNPIFLASLVCWINSIALIIYFQTGTEDFWWKTAVSKVSCQRSMYISRNVPFKRLGKYTNGLWVHSFIITGCIDLTLCFRLIELVTTFPIW